MYFVPKFPKKVQFLFTQSYTYVAKLCEKTEVEKFVGGRKGYDKELLFLLLLIKKATNWSFRTVAEMGGVSHSTLVRANTYLSLISYIISYIYMLKRFWTAKIS